MKASLFSCAPLAAALFAVGCGATPDEPIVVNTLEDPEEPPEGTVTLRSALGSAASGQPIVFDASLDGGVIELTIVGDAHTVLKGEVMGIREEPSGPVSYLVGYFDRDYGRSALYESRGSALDQVPVEPYSVEEVLGEYRVALGHQDTFLAVVLGRVEAHYGLDGFASDFTADFEAFLRSVDLDEEAPGMQPYLDPSGEPILTLAATRWFGPSRTWPSYLPNYPYIHFWHRLDRALLGAGIDAMGHEVLGDDAWSALFDSGPLAEDPGISMALWEQNQQAFSMLAVDQRGAPRPIDGPADIGAIEVAN